MRMMPKQRTPKERYRIRMRGPRSPPLNPNIGKRIARVLEREAGKERVPRSRHTHAMHPPICTEAARQAAHPGKAPLVQALWERNRPTHNRPMAVTRMRAGVFELLTTWWGSVNATPSRLQL